jgi:hypothetical protein
LSVSKAGFCFPNTGRWTDDSGHHALASTVTSSQRDELVNALIEEISLVPHHIILSSEEFTHMLWRDAQGFQRLVDRILAVADRVTVIVYLRHQADFIESNYLERLKSQFRLGFAAYAFARVHEDLAEFPLDYRRLVEVLARIQNVDVDVRSYDAVRASGALADFLSAIDWPSGHPIEECRINESLPIADSLKNFCRAQLQQALSDSQERTIELIALKLPARPRMDVHTRLYFTRHFEASNRELAERFSLAPLREATPDEYIFGEWTGLGDSAPPHQESMWQVTLDHLFSRTFVDTLQAASERLGNTHAALAELQALALERHTQIETLQQALDTNQAALTTTQTLALERHAQIETLRQALDTTQAALTKTQALALERYAQIETLQEALAQNRAVPKWQRLFKR